MEEEKDATMATDGGKSQVTSEATSEAKAGTVTNPLPRLKKPATPYFQFVQERRASVRAEHPDMPMAQRAKVFGAMWKELGAEERKTYDDGYKAGLAKWNEEMQRRKEAGLVTEGDEKHKAYRAKVMAANAKKEALPKLKKPTTAYFRFVTSVRKEVKAANPDLGLGALQKVIAARWKSMPDAEKAPFIEAGRAEQEAYRTEMARRKRLGLRTVGEDGEKRGRTDDVLHTDIPLSRVKRVLRADKEFGSITKQGLLLTSIATEAFLASLTKAAGSAAAPRKTLKPDDFARAIHNHKAFAFMRRDFAVGASVAKLQSSAKPAAKVATGASSIQSYFAAKP